jgi:hypothetical protein
MERDDDVGPPMRVEVEIDQRQWDETADRVNRTCGVQRFVGARNQLDVREAIEEVAYVAGQLRPGHVVGIDDENHRSAAHNSPNRSHIGGITNTTRTIPTAPISNPTVAISFVSISPEA